MPENNAERVSTADIINQARQEIKEQIKKIETEPDPQTKNQQRQELAETIKQEVKDVKRSAEEAVKNEIEAKKGREMFIKQTEANQALRTIVKAAEAAKNGIQVSATDEGQLLLSKLAEKSLSWSLASAIESRLADYLIGEKQIIDPSGQPTEGFQQQFNELKEVNSAAAKLIGDILIQAAAAGEIARLSEEEARRRFTVEEAGSAPSEEGGGDGLTRENFDGLFEREKLSDFYQEEDKRVLKALYSPREFKNFVNEIKQAVEGEDPGLSEEEIAKEVSRRLEKEIGGIFTKLFFRVDEALPNKTFEEVIREGSLWGSIEVIYNNLRNKIQVLKEYFYNHPEEFDFNFYIRYSEGKTGEIKIQTDQTDQILPVYSVEPYYSQRAVEPGVFLDYLYRQAENVFNWGRYKQNVRVAFTQGTAGEKGFWDQIGAYANRFMRTTDLEQIFLLYNNELILEALRLYTQYCYEMMGGLYNWTHQAALFSPGERGMNAVEKEVYQALEETHRDEIRQGKIKKWELRSALSSAVGLSLGVLLTEIEIAAQADPNLEPAEGRPTYVSFWRSDSTILKAFFPAFDILRFQAESMTWGPMAFLPIPDPKKIKRFFGLFYDHRSVYNDIREFYQSFYKGEMALSKKGFVRFIDMVNPGRVGSFITRGGWRDFYGYEGWVGDKRKVKKEGGTFWSYDYEAAFKRLDSVGFEFLLDLVTNKFEGFYAESTDEQRNSLFRFIYDTYFKTEGYKEEDFDDYAREHLKNEEQQKEFMKEALARIFVLRLPAKYLAMERNRLSPTGERMWERMRQRLGFGVEEMDQVVKDLILAQNELRKDTSNKMDEKMAQGGDLAEVAGEYFLNEEKINRYLRGLGLDDARVNKVVQLYRCLLTEFINNEQVLKDFGNKLFKGREYFPFALAPEEIDYRYFAIRGTGERTIVRTLTDTSSIEQAVGNSFSQLMETCHKASISGKTDFGPMVEIIKKAKEAIQALHGKEVANKYALCLAYATISYFQKDTLARAVGGLAGWGGINSVAAEFAGGSARVWEWDPRTIGRFIYALEAEYVLEKQPYEQQKPPTFESLMEKMKAADSKLVRKTGEVLSKPLKIRLGGKEFNLNPFNWKINPLNWKIFRKKDFEIYSATLKKYGYGGLVHKLVDLLISYTPVGLAILLAFMIINAFKEWFGKKK